MPNAAQEATYKFIRSEIARLRGPESYTALSQDKITPLVDEGDNAVFRVNGAPVLIKKSGIVSDTGLPDCPTYAYGLLPKYFLPAIAADLLSRGNPHKPLLHSQSHTPESFIAYLQHGTLLSRSQSRPVATPCKAKPATTPKGDPYNFVLQFPPTEIDELVARRLTNVEQERAFEAGRSIAAGNLSRENLNAIVEWKMEGVHLTRVMSFVAQNTDEEIARALKSAIEADTEAKAIEILDRLHGVGVPVASAILTDRPGEVHDHRHLRLTIPRRRGRADGQS